MNNVNKIELTYHGVIYSKKNHKRIINNPRTGKKMIVSGVKAMQNEEDMVKQFKWIKTAEENKVLFEHFPEPPYLIEVLIWEKDRTRRDLDNQATSLLDALVKSGIIPDDDWKMVPEINAKFMGIDKYDPHASIRISHLEIPKE